MRFTGTSSAGSPWGPSASTTVHRSSFEALWGEWPVMGRRILGCAPPPTSEPASLLERGCGRAVRVTLALGSAP